eukprot:gnl/MRDRNA2_/MRDRNA2_89338_c0_seq1.p1 gnl/MRDRNA2_/MRDRNA2_89338_c0~~gnl/MRDRNA2_/MRDRNA2_89338_c0_seq1.p1  ORF type:complete len:1020 (-),score=179.88 gnl/MRDRNA2_/MRDRNA2_89338_c0_seq1:199-3189(-)
MFANLSNLLRIASPQGQVSHLPKAVDGSVRIIVLVDATGSMGSYCSSVGSTLKQLFAVLDVLFEGTAQVDIVAYEDYCDGDRVLSACEGGQNDRKTTKEFAAKLRAGGGGDHPEAVKTALNHIVEILRKHNADDAEASRRTVVIHYTDAPPHHRTKVGSNKDNLDKEIKAMKSKEPGFDWVQICKAFLQLGTPVITFIAQTHCNSVTSRFLLLLGHIVSMPNTTPETITKYTMGVLLQLMGQPFEDIMREFFVSPVDVSSLENEDAPKFIEQLDAGTETTQYRFEAHDAFVRDLRKLTQRFQESEDFQDMVFRALSELFVPESVLAITYNSVLGMLWRLVCKRREDPRVQPLCDALSTCCTALTGTNQAQLRTWIDESYNQLEEIREIIEAVENPLAEGVLVLDASNSDDMPSKEEMRSILHAPTPGVLRKVQALLTRLIIVKSGEVPVTQDVGGEMVPMYVPLALSDTKLFSLLAHLLLPGMMTSLRPAAMLAILAHLSGNATLQPRAKRFLESIRGKWIPAIDKAEDYPEILNGEFVRLIVRAPEFLTEAEQKLYAHLRLILRVRSAGKLRVPVKVGYTPTHQELTPDHKILCKSCGIHRSMTLMKDGTCGLCLRTDIPADSSFRRDCPEPAEDKSHMVECRSCNALYAIVNISAFNVAPKCHYCRMKEPCQSVTCVKCENKFCAPTASSRVDGFECAVCSVDPGKGLPVREAQLNELAEVNPGTVCCLGLSEDARIHIFGRLGLFKLWMSHEDDLLAVEPSRLETLQFKGKPVKNVTEVFDMIVENVLRGRLVDICNLCFEERPLALLQSACGMCQNLACQDCLGHWYGQLAPGRIYVPSEGLCAFCKRTPKAKTLHTFNRLACRLAGRKTLQLRADMYYGWCRTCFQIAEAVPRVCAAEVPVLRDFECEPCKTKRLLQSDESVAKMSKACPKCKAPTMKISGCNHITCHCDAHWCWQCGGEFDETEIYDHMQNVHGSIGIDGEEDDFSEDEH